MAPVRRLPIDPPPLYGTCDELFSVEIHHGGFFSGHGKNKMYVDGRLDWFDQCEVDTWSPLWIKDFVQKLGYDAALVDVYWLLPGKHLSDGLRIVDRDVDTLSMTTIVPKIKTFILYLHQKGTCDSLDDACISGSPALPSVLSPKKPIQVHGANQFPKKAARRSTRARPDVKATIDDDTDSEDSDSSCDTDFHDSDNEISKDDDDLYEQWVDHEEEDAAIPSKKAPTSRKKSSVEDKENLSCDELELPNSDDDDIQKFRRFRPEDMLSVEFRVGMVFPSVVELRRAISEYIIQQRVQIKYAKNDLQRIRAHCQEDCPWYLFAAPDSRTKCFMVKTYIKHHSCAREWELKQFTAKYLAEKYKEKFRADDKMSLRNFGRTVQTDYNMIPSRSKLSRARRLAMKWIYGDEVNQYNQLWDYAAELRRSNPGSTMFLNLKDGNFSTLYTSLDACKRGLMTGCRPIICLDGTHIKTKFGGQLLTAVGIDPNDCIFPIAMAIVEVEDTKTWKWFLNTLKDDLALTNSGAWTFMSDRQKGLINAVQAVFPTSPHRFCVRHLYQNFSSHWKGENLKNKLWAIARSTNMIHWRTNMDDMKEMNQEAYEYLEAVDPKSWCRAFFTEYPKCDMLLNNSCEVFNKYILDARDLPVLSMLMKIKDQLMTRYYQKRKECADEWTGTICPKIKKKLEKNTDLANLYFAKPTDSSIFSVAGKTGLYIVDISKNQCSCRRWQLTGIPCSHSIACFRHERIKPEDKVHTCYNIAAYKAAYGGVIMPCRYEREWEKMNGVNVNPPKYEKKVGRPSKKRKQKAEENEDGTKISRHGAVQHCSICHSTEHNKRKCKEVEAIRLRTERGEGPAEKLPVQRHRPTSQTEMEEPISQASSTTTVTGGTQAYVSVLDSLMVDAAPTQLSQISATIPKSSFITSSRDALPPQRSTTATLGAAVHKKKKPKKAKGA